MRSLSPAFVLTSVAIALASTAAAAQTVRSTSAPAPTATAPTSSTARATTGGCTGTGGSSCTASGTSTSASSTGASSSLSGAFSSSSGAPSETTGANVSTAANNNATGAVTTVDNTSNNSTGPLSGLVENNGNTAISGDTSATGPSGTGTTNHKGFASGLLVPGLGTDLRALDDAGSGLNANGERVAGNGNGNAANNGAALNTLTTGNTVYTLPLYDTVTKAATARELRRRAAKQEPRVIGLAPRTDKDLTYQMPNDRIIRY